MVDIDNCIVLKLPKKNNEKILKDISSAYN